MKRSRLLVLVIGWLFFSAPIYAAPIEAHYVTSAELPPQLLPPPPEEGSLGWRKNIDSVLAAQKHMNADDLTALRDEQHMRVGLITDVMGADFTRATFPLSYALLDNVFTDTEMISSADKQFWHTQRPYLTDQHVKLMVDAIDHSPAYPSGHTSGSRVLAEVLGMLYPDHRAALRARADAIAWHRVEAGVHYPCDIGAGQLLAMLVVGALQKDTAFQDDLAAARREVEGAE